jgi:hypothetical protein
LEIGRQRRWLARGLQIASLLGIVGALGVIGVLFAPHLGAQGCAMCYQSAAATGAQGGQALRHGILILLFPTLSLFIGIFGLIFSRRNTSR